MGFSNTKDQLTPFISDVFFETGTYLGFTSNEAKRIGYPRVVTIELQEHLYNQAIKNSIGGIEYHLGDSPKIMGELLPGMEGKITFWLDAHIDSGNYIPEITPEIRECPLYEELYCIMNLKRNDHTILIDDICIIGNIGWGIGTIKEELIRMILIINKDYKIYYIEGKEPDDILVATI